MLRWELELGKDNVVVYDGNFSNSSTPILATFTGAQFTPSAPVWTSGRAMSIVFTSDANLELGGFLLTYEAFDCPHGCNGKGGCVGGVCNCNQGYAEYEAYTCSLDCGQYGVCVSL